MTHYHLDIADEPIADAKGKKGKKRKLDTSAGEKRGKKGKGKKKKKGKADEEDVPEDADLAKPVYVDRKNCFILTKFIV